MATKWVIARNGEIPAGAIEGGFDDDGTLYICRAKRDDGMHPGKIRPEFEGCRIAWNGHEVTVPEYEVLVAKTHPCSEAIRHVFDLTDWMGAMPFMTSIKHQQDELQRRASDIQGLAIDCGCVPLADTADRLAELAADPFTDADVLQAQVEKVKAATEHCV